MPITFNLQAAYYAIMRTNQDVTYNLLNYTYADANNPPTPQTFRSQVGFSAGDPQRTTYIDGALSPFGTTRYQVVADKEQMNARALGFADQTGSLGLPTGAAIGASGLLPTLIFEAGTIGANDGLLAWFRSWSLLDGGNNTGLFCVDQIPGGAPGGGPQEAMEGLHECTQIATDGTVLAGKKIEYGGAARDIIMRNY